MVIIGLAIIISIAIASIFDRYCKMVERLAELEARDESNDL